MKSRSGSRRKRRKRAVIRFEGGRGEAECIVREVSQEGAQILVASTSGIPSEFKLFVGDDAPGQACFVQWRRPRRLGVQFLSPALTSLSL